VDIKYTDGQTRKISHYAGAVKVFSGSYTGTSNTFSASTSDSFACSSYMHTINFMLSKIFVPFILPTVGILNTKIFAISSLSHWPSRQNTCAHNVRKSSTIT